MTFPVSSRRNLLKKRGLRIWVARVFRDGARKWIHFSWRGQISIESC